jgi:ATP-dependent Clp protease, protease subunit
MSHSKIHPQVFASSRPSALPVPADRRIQALTSHSVLSKWTEDAACFRLSAKSGANVITMFDVIGYDYWTGGGITAKSVQEQLRSIGDNPVEVQINSPGGDVFEGIAIYNVLREHSAEVTIKIIGLAASAASIIAMAGDKIEIGAASFLMIHNCWVIQVGNRHDMKDTADWLAPFDTSLAEVYSARSGQIIDQCAAWMDAETYMSGSIAIERGFADSLLSSDKISADEGAAAKQRDANVLRGMEYSLCATGRSRTEARAEIKKIKGMSDSAPEVMSDSDEFDWSAAMAGLTKSILQ